MSESATRRRRSRKTRGSHSPPGDRQARLPGEGERIFAALPRIPTMKKQSFFN
jgi:hypothetical protein